MLPVGSPAIGDDFIDREIEVKKILLALEKDNVILIAPRKFGKTSIMRRMERELLNLGGMYIFLEVEDVYTPERFISEIIMGLVDNERSNKKSKIIASLKKTYQWFKDNVDEFDTPIFKAKLRASIEDDFKGEWTAKTMQLSEVLKNLSSKLYIIIDEFPVAIKNMDPKEAIKLLRWFKKLRQLHIENPKFIVGGSVSLDRVVRDIGGDDVIDDFKRIMIYGFERDVALKVIMKIFEEEGWKYDSSLGNMILECIGEPYIPYFIAIILSAIKEETIQRNKQINEKQMKEIYNKTILGSEGKHYFEPYSQRLRISYPEMDEKAARKILKMACKNEFYNIDIAFGLYKKETGINDYEKFMDLIETLRNDFYLEFDPNNGLKFQSKMLRDWWRLYHG